jgi:hydrogenase/urease accessory protein HupE
MYSRFDYTRSLALFLAFLAVPWTAEAHSIGKNIGDFYWGFLHPATSMESAFPLIALGLLAGQQGAEKARWMIGLFALGIIAGPLIALSLGTPVLASWVNLISFIILGALLALARPWPLPVLAGLSLVFGLTQGWSNAAEMTQATGKLLYACGMILGGYLIVLLLAAFAVNTGKSAEWQRIALRIAGSWIAAIGLMVIALQ